ncbi:MAG TPA: hypothetical protein VMR52_09975 [Dehalococcoidia bacterium]|nr:hypothetical protein [Dehalococcoidia bacterium]
MTRVNNMPKVKETIDARRERAAGALDKAGNIVRERSHQAATIIDKGGSRAADALQGSAERIQPHRGFVRRNLLKRSTVMLGFALLVLMGVAVIIRSQARSDDEDDLDF